MQTNILKVFQLFIDVQFNRSSFLEKKEKKLMQNKIIQMQLLMP